MSEPHVLHLVWNLIRGGTEGQCARTALALAGAGWIQRVGVSRREGFFLEAIERACGPVFVMEIEHVLRPRTFSEVRRLARFIRGQRIDVVHAWDADAALFGAAASVLAGVPLITSRRDLGEIYASRKLALMRLADKRARAVVVNAQAIADSAACRHIPREKIRAIPNILDIEEFEHRRQAPLLPVPEAPPGRCVAMVARLDPEKDVATLLRAIPQVATAIPDARFVLVGDGRERGALEALVSQLGIRNSVHFVGECNEVPALLGPCEIGVLVPNRNEGLSNTILEYMAAGLPVVATDCGGNRELVEEGRTGYIVRPGDANALADRLIALLNNPQLARHMGAAGRSVVEANHRPAAVAERFATLYREVCGHSDTPGELD
ncbi:MAG: glycosyltransferase [Kiritimatiellae bacterium]|nr:glycosyltransferase [Kiritimatiellia bacterium]